MILGTLLFLAVLVGFGIWGALTSGSYQTANRDSVGLAPKPEEELEAVVQVYSARAFGWRRPYALHTWIAIKEKSADHYSSYQIVGWKLYRAGSALVVENGIPDRRWYGSDPSLLVTLKGPQAESAIPKIVNAVREYPYKEVYRVWPGPNSNTFISSIIRQTPEIGMELPPHAIGRDWLVEGKFWEKSESGTGYQLSFYGVLGLTLGLGEGIEVSILGLTFGIDILRPALKLPFYGRLGVADKPAWL